MPETMASFVLKGCVIQYVPNCFKFLRKLRKRNLGYSVLNSARGMLSSFATIERHDTGKHSLVCWYMSGVHN